MTRRLHEVLRTIQVVCITIILAMLVYSMMKCIAVAIVDTHPVITTVIDCQQYEGDEYYTVTVEDDNGDVWEYYDNDYREVGEILNAKFDGESITDIGEN